MTAPARFVLFALLRVSPALAAMSPPVDASAEAGLPVAARLGASRAAPATGRAGPAVSRIDFRPARAQGASWRLRFDGLGEGALAYALLVGPPGWPRGTLEIRVASRSLREHDIRADWRFIF